MHKPQKYPSNNNNMKQNVIITHMGIVKTIWPLLFLQYNKLLNNWIWKMYS